MRSPGSATRLRRSLERAFRAGAVVLVAVALWRSWDARREVSTATVVEFSAGPSATERDSLRALARSGRAIAWRGDVAPIALGAEPAREPGDRWRVAAIAAGASSLGDALGPIDSLEAGGGTLTTRTPRAGWRLTAMAEHAGARVSARPEIGRVFVLGHAGWEAKFTIAALEEDGWGVDARLLIGPRDVGQGDARLRRARHSVVVVLDTLAANANALAAFVRAGGGIVLAGEAAAWRASALRELVPATATRRVPAETREVLGHEPTHALALVALDRLAPDALALEHRDDFVSVAARRVRAGRVIQVGYEELWRWRMQGEETAVRDHRLWWSRVVGAAAGTDRAPAPPPLVDRTSLEAPSSAPLAELVHALGPAVHAEAPSHQMPAPLSPWLGVAILSLLLAEWGSRRARGAA
jgi:hypothetical protein